MICRSCSTPWSPRSPGRGHSLHLVAHPIYAVEMDITGTLQSVVPGSPDAAPESAIRESWIHLEIDLRTDPEQHTALEQVLHAVLSDVREAVEDWQRMTAEALTLADELRASPPSSVPAEVQPGGRGVPAMAGRGQLHLPGLPPVRPGPRSRPQCAGQPAWQRFGSVARGPGAVPIVLRDASGGARHATEPRILVLTKANSRSTVHRPVPLDYVGSSDSTPTAR